MIVSPATSLHLPNRTARHTPRGGNLAGATPVPASLFEQAAQFLAQIRCGSAAELLPAPVARARRDNSGLFHRESRPQIFLKIDHLTHVDGSLGCIRNRNRSAFP